jgi:hypothetical protein
MSTKPKPKAEAVKLPAYRLHAQAQAALIKAVLPAGHKLGFPDSAALQLDCGICACTGAPWTHVQKVTKEWVEEHKPKKGSYYVLFCDKSIITPAKIFQSCYEKIGPATGVSIGAALATVKAGGRAWRKGWIGAGMWIALTPGQNVPADKVEGAQNAAYAKTRLDKVVTLHPFITLKTADGGIVPWQISQTDAIAEDWHVDPKPYTTDIEVAPHACACEKK